MKTVKQLLITAGLNPNFGTGWMSESALLSLTGFITVCGIDKDKLVNEVLLLKGRSTRKINRNTIGKAVDNLFDKSEVPEHIKIMIEQAIIKNTDHSVVTPGYGGKSW